MSGISFTPSKNISASKSIMNRLLICKSYFPNLEIQSESDCEDVDLLQRAVSNLNQENFYVGSGGTTFRFLCLRLSRYPGKHKISMSPSLYHRPHDSLNHLLDQLDVNYVWQDNAIEIQGKPWSLNKAIEVKVDKSSQILSALLLNSWLLEDDLDIFYDEPLLSTPYIKMTLEILNFLGLKWEVLDSGFRIRAKQEIQKFSVSSEIDMSSAFTLAAIATIHHGHSISPFIYPSLQADANFLPIFEELGIPFMLADYKLNIYPVKDLKAIDCDLKDSPDLFPILAVLCSMAQGESKLYGARQLIYKESNRIASLAKLFDTINISYQRLEDGMVITGSPQQILRQATPFYCEEDHRIAFAAALAKVYGHNLIIEGADCVDKSFKNFWQQFNTDFCTMDLYP